MRRFLLFLVVTGLSTFSVFSQNRQSTVSGYVTVASTGESVIGATVYTSDKTVGTTTDDVGRYVLSLRPGKYEIVCSCVGYTNAVSSIEIKDSDITLNIEIAEDKEQLEAASVFSISKKEMLKLPQMGMKSVGVETIKRMPTLLGETDVIKVIQMMPGVQSPSEGSTGFSVRGGGVDQNLILMDGAPIYNSGHFLGFFSMFNGDVVKNVKLYKGDFPAKYGEKVASVLDISTVDGNMNRLSGSASLGLLTSKIFLEGPIVKNKLSFAVAARRSYVDLFFPLLKNYIPSNTKLAFWDINAKLNWAINDNNRLTASAFSSKDLFGVNLEDMGVTLMTFRYRNNVQSLKWSHVTGSKTTFTVTGYNSQYMAGIEADMDQAPFDWKNVINETGVRNAFIWHINSNNTLEMGLNLVLLNLNPSETHPVGEESIVLEVINPKQHAFQPTAYIQNEQKMGILTVRYGLRYSKYLTMGPTDQYFYDEKTHERTQSKHYDKFEVIRSFSGLDPRLSASLSISENASFKAAYARTHQFLQQTSVSTSPGVIDAWFSASPNVEPLIADQVSVGFNHNFANDALQLSLEGFYKYNQNTVDLKDNQGLVIDNEDREGLLRKGTSYAYGAEAMLEYDFARVNGWVGYTWSKAMYDIPENNHGNPYRSPLNHEHAVNFVITFNLSKRVDASATWIYYSGAPTTFPVARYLYNNTYIPIYSDRNSDSMPDYHRLDLSLNVKSKRLAEGTRKGGEWNFSVYNAYNRHNAWSISSGYNRKEERMSSTLIYIFAVVPSVSYTFKF